jgi:rare lipoprotein A
MALLPWTARAEAEDAGVPADGGVEIGIASWYGPDFQGRRTSDGEVYDKEKLTAAHRTLPFGTYLLVRNLDNGSSVVVRVNDRGPFAKNRLIDLSEAAARIIGMVPTGTARVAIAPIPAEEALAWKGGSLDGAGVGAGVGAGGSASVRASPNASPAAPIATAPSPSRVRIQVASYASEANAKATVERLAASGMGASIERAGDYFRVVFPDLSPEDSRLIAQRLEGLGYRGLAITTITTLGGE